MSLPITGGLDLDGLKGSFQFKPFYDWFAAFQWLNFWEYQYISLSKIDKGKWKSHSIILSEMLAILYFRLYFFHIINPLKIISALGYFCLRFWNSEVPGVVLVHSTFMVLIRILINPQPLIHDLRVFLCTMLFSDHNYRAEAQKGNSTNFSKACRGLSTVSLKNT